VNFLTHDYSKEIRFQDMYSKQEILDMIKDHSYEENFRRFMTSEDQLRAHTSLHKKSKGEGGDIERKREVLFRKQLTPSDIGKLNQLVLPKYHAERYFPLNEVHGRRDVLVFKDEEDKLWEFGYTFRRCYLLTTGWKSFVKHKDLRAGDIVCFERGNSCNIITVITAEHHDEEEHHVQSLQPQGESRNSNGETSSQTCPLFGLDVLHPRREG
jgi:RAV-like factor